MEERIIKDINNLLTQLFQKMKEAGYEWDAEKKELKKIEKGDCEPDDLIEESYQQQADDLIDIVTEKPVWSEEDEQYLLVCKNALAKYQVSDKWDAKIISQWLENKLKK